VQSTEDERIASGVPFVAPATQRIYVFFFVGWQRGGPFASREYDSGNLWFVCSDDRGAHWSTRRLVPLPDREISIFSGRFHGWVNQPPQLMPTGEVILPIGMVARFPNRDWRGLAAECSLVMHRSVLQMLGSAGGRASSSAPRGETSPGAGEPNANGWSPEDANGGASAIGSS
jgi:hypothetical protein